MKTDDRHVKKSLEETFNEMHKPKLSYPGPYRAVPNPDGEGGYCVVGPAKISIADCTAEDAPIIAAALNAHDVLVAAIEKAAAQVEHRKLHFDGERREFVNGLRATLKAVRS